MECVISVQTECGLEIWLQNLLWKIRGEYKNTFGFFLLNKPIYILPNLYFVIYFSHLQLSTEYTIILF